MNLEMKKIIRLTTIYLKFRAQYYSQEFDPDKVLPYLEKYKPQFKKTLQLIADIGNISAKQFIYSQADRFNYLGDERFFPTPHLLYREEAWERAILYLRNHKLYESKSFYAGGMFPRIELKRKKVKVISHAHFILQCRVCNRTWSPQNTSSGNLPGNYWQCFNGCNRYNT